MGDRPARLQRRPQHAGPPGGGDQIRAGAAGEGLLTDLSVRGMADVRREPAYGTQLPDHGCAEFLHACLREPTGRQPIGDRGPLAPISLSLSVRPSVHPSVCPSVRLSVWVNANTFIILSLLLA